MQLLTLKPFFSTSGLNNETIVIEDDDSGSDYTDVDSDEYDDDEEYAEVGEPNEGEFEDDFTDEEESDDDEDEHETESEESDTEDLSQGEMRLLNLNNINKIDVKVNFQQEYSDTDCHFCRKKETNEHLAKCPVYEGIMIGSEFKDIKSKNIHSVKRALYNIKSALLKRH